VQHAEDTTTQLPRADAVLQFWFGELDATGRADEAHSARWWSKDAALDASIREQFLALHKALMLGECASWRDSARGRLAYLIVLDQFSRNMFRDSAEMFASDELAMTAAMNGIDLDLDRQLRVDERAFFYMPLMHSEQLEAHERCVNLYKGLATELPEALRANMTARVKYAEQHRDIIRRFGRFPHRNAMLARESTPEELEFLKQPGSTF
jgi:uncharacterized protein (DUF924 family)